MRKTDYEIIAGILARHRPTTMRDAAWSRRWERIVVDLGKVFQKHNPRFCLVKWQPL